MKDKGYVELNVQDEEKERRIAANAGKRDAVVLQLEVTIYEIPAPRKEMVYLTIEEKT
jgi:hypothetical protein